MRFNKVLLISPPTSSRYGGLRVPAGIGHIAQALHDNDIEYEYIDMRVGKTSRELKKKALSFKPDLIGVSMITLGYLDTYRMLSFLKKLFPSSKIVVGGHHPTILKEMVLEECADIDFGVVSDGEKTIIELCRDDIPLKDIQGLIFRNGRQIVFTGERPPVKDLDGYSFPKYEKFNMSDYSKQIPVHFSRGCVNLCTFCPNKVLGRRYKEKSVGYFVDEIEHWYARGYRQFAIDDDNFTLNKKKVYEICDEIEMRGFRDLLLRCSNGLRADRVDRRLLARLKEIGVREVGFGVDGGNNRVLGYLKKGETIETIEQSIKDACELGLDVKIFIIVGTPHETKADVEDSIRLARKYPVARVNFNNAIPYPGTEMFDYIKANNLFLIPPEEYLNSASEDKPVFVFETPEFPREERMKMLKKCYAVEREVMKNTAYRMFKRYPFSRIIIKYIFNVKLFEWLFFKNLALRKLLERMRYHILMKR